MKRAITSVGSVLPGIILWADHPVLAFIIPVLLAVVVLAFWTGAVGVRYEKD
jgi:hypothetical protein